MLAQNLGLAALAKGHTVRFNFADRPNRQSASDSRRRLHPGMKAGSSRDLPA